MSEPVGFFSSVFIRFRTAYGLTAALKKFLLNSFVLLCALVFCLLLCEGTFYLLDKLSPLEKQEIETVSSTPNEERLDFFQYDSVFGIAGLPNVQKEFYGKLITHNARGLRGPELDYKKPPNTIRIAFIGDSQTWGWSVADDETIPSYTASLLNGSKLKSKVEVLNFGVTGYGIGQSYLRLISEGLRYQPDFVVLTYFADNDIWESTSYEAWGIEKPYFYEKRPGRQLCVSNIPPRRATGWPSDNIGHMVKDWKVGIAGLEFDLADTYTAQYFKNRSFSSSLMGLFGNNDDPIAAINREIGCLQAGPGPLLKNWNAKMDFTTRLIYVTRDTVEKYGGRFILVAKPLPDDYRNGTRHYDYDYVLRRLELSHIDLIDLYPAARRADLTPEQFFLGAGHLTARGNHLAAEKVAEEVRHLLEDTRTASQAVF